MYRHEACDAINNLGDTTPECVFLPATAKDIFKKNIPLKSHLLDIVLVLLLKEVYRHSFQTKKKFKRCLFSDRIYEFLNAATFRSVGKSGHRNFGKLFLGLWAR